MVRDASFKTDLKLNDDAIVSWGDLFSLVPGQIINVKCHVATIYDSTTHKTRNGEDVVKQDVIISDSSNSIKLVLYGEDIASLTTGKSYILRNLRLNSFKDLVYLNTTLTKKFKVEGIDEIEHITEVSAATDTTVLCKIVGIDKICINFHCTKCNKKLLDDDVDDSVIFKCVECKAQMLRSNCRISLRFSLVLSDVTKNVNISLFFPNDQAFQLKSIIHTLPVSAAHVQSSKNNKFFRYYVMFGRNDRSVLVGKIPVFMRKY